MKDMLSIIHSRKSVRKYLDKPVKRDELEVILKAGMAAPTAKDSRPWAFIAVTDKNILTKLAQGPARGKMLAQAGAGIVVCGIKDKFLEGESGGFWVQDCAAATQNILLAAEAQGLGAVWIGLHPVGERAAYVGTVFCLPENIVPFGIISIGHPEGNETPKIKFDQGNIHWNSW